jgi:hypothetical protein
MSWIPLNENLLLSGTWQDLPPHEGELYRISFVSGEPSPSGIGRYDVGQFDVDGSGYNLRTYRTETFGTILLFKKPEFFQSQHLGFRYPAGFNPYTIKVEVNDMPLSSLSNLSGSSGTNQAIVGASTNQVVISAANAERKGLQITNKSAKSLFLDFDNEVTVVDYAVEVKANTLYEMPVSFLGDVRGIWAAGATGSCKVVEFI